VQVDPIKPKLKPPGTKRLKLKCDESLSNLAFNFNLRRFIMAVNEAAGTLVYKATPKDVSTRSEVGVLRVEGGALVEAVTPVPLAPSYLQSKCNQCFGRRDAFRFNAASYTKAYDVNVYNDVVIMVGSSRLGGTDNNYFPSILKLKADTVGFSGDGEEMYFDDTRIPQAGAYTRSR